MVKIGSVFYDQVGNQYIIERLLENGYFICNTVRKTTIIFNDYSNKTNKDINVELKFSVNDIGTILFIDINDFNNHKNGIVMKKEYFVNEKTIKEYFEKIKEQEYKKIEKYRPKGLVATQDLINEKINSYPTQDKEYDEEMRFHNENFGCFGRVDIDTIFYDSFSRSLKKERFYEKVYLTNEKYQFVDGAHIVNWRSPIAALYYDNSKTILELNSYLDVLVPKDSDGVATINTNYRYENTLLLKRTFQFNPLRFQNTYIQGQEIFEEGSSDSFLLSLLKSNRNNKLNDIIKTIQSNQNKIIREKNINSIIVQGCAGSGKTMILLHRLSYLKYNRLLPTSEKIVIITPNNYFDNFISDLAKKMEIEKIKRATLKQYYLDIAISYQNLFTINNSNTAADNFKNQNENIRYIRDQLTKISISDELKYDLKINIFSSVNIALIRNVYQVEIHKIKNEINIEAIQEILKRNDFIIDEETYKKKMSYFNEIDEVLRRQLPSKNTSNLREIEILKNSSDIKTKFLNGLREVYARLSAFEDNDKIVELTNILERNREHIAYIIKKTFKTTPLGVLASAEKFKECYVLNKLNFGTTIYVETDRYKMEIENDHKTISEMESKLLSELDVVSINKAINILDKKAQIVFDIFRIIQNQFRQKQNINCDINVLMRSELFVLVLLYSTHCGKLKNRERFVCIDEGQDYHINEYKLIKNVLPSSCVFNIYGDIDQVITRNGLGDWDELKNILNAEKFILSENYRNTNEITQFINDNLGYSMFPIGIRGSQVLYLDEKLILSRIQDEYSNNSDVRICIITNDLKISLELREAFKDYSVFVGSVFEMKGLEFDVAFVFYCNMEKSEKYISFTRALEKLYLVN